MQGWHKRCQGLVCDVRERSMVDRVLEQAKGFWGSIDIIVKYLLFPPLWLTGLIRGKKNSCTGYGIIGACEDQDEHDIRAQFETNVTGLVNIVQSTLPYFRERGGGRYIVFSSLHGLISAPGLGRRYSLQRSRMHG